jgi:2',3'-cyclic-nucleotide 2'-phosphodiesterase (5'-nucleotidase family)
MRFQSRRPLTFFTLALALLAWSGNSSASQGALTQKILPVLSSSDAIGKITPCGCHTPKGGLARIASVIDSTKIKYGDALVVEAGDFAPERTNAIEEARIDFQFKTLELIGYDAIGIGERELNFGYAKLKALAASSKVPLLCANLIDKKTGQPAFKPYTIVKKGNLKVGVFAVLGPKIELPADAGEELTVEDPLAAAQRTVAALRKQCDVVVVLAHVGRVEGEDLAAQVPGMDVVILAHHPGFVAQGRRVNSAVTVASGEQIQNMGVTRVMLGGKKVLDLASESIILMPEVGERSDIARLVKDFEDSQNEKLRKQQQSNALPVSH